MSFDGFDGLYAGGIILATVTPSTRLCELQAHQMNKEPMQSGAHQDNQDMTMLPIQARS